MMNNRDFIAKRAAAYFKPGDVVNLGIGIPSLCGSYAVSGVLFQSENGFIGIGPKAEGLMVNERYANAGGVNFVPVPGSSAFDVAASFCVIRSGRLAATVLGGLQVSADGDLANWATPCPSPPCGASTTLSPTAASSTSPARAWCSPRSGRGIPWRRSRPLWSPN